MTKQALVVYNPTARSTADPEAWLPHLTHALCEKDDFMLTLYSIEKAQSLHDLAAILASPRDLVIAAGGDGTVRFTLAALAKTGSKIPAAILPLGTANVLARNLGIVDERIFANPLERAFDVMVHGVPVNIDMGVMNGELFAVTAGAGPLSDAFIAPDGEEKSKLKLFAYAAYAIKTMAVSPIVFNIKADGESFDVEASGVFVSNVEDLGIGKVPDFNLLQDGLLDLYILVPKEFSDYVDIGFRFAGGKSNGDPPYYVRKVKEATIKVLHTQAPTEGFHTTAQTFLGPQDSMVPTDNDEVATMLDGENCGFTPMTCKVFPHAVNVIALPRA